MQLIYGSLMLLLIPPLMLQCLVYPLKWSEFYYMDLFHRVTETNSNRQHGSEVLNVVLHDCWHHYSHWVFDSKAASWFQQNSCKL